MGNNASHRRKHRQQSHSQSHAEATITPTLKGNPLVCEEKPVWIDTTDKFHELCDEFKANGIFAFDTEFIGEDTYFAKTCLIQVATSDKIALIDPFVIKDLSPLHALICDENIITVVHAGSQDFEPVTRLSSQAPASVFDTQIAAGFIGLPWPLSLTKTIHTILNHDVGGHFTFSQWDERPLSKRQIHYAADDVRYLLAIYDYLSKELSTLDRENWVLEECSKFTSKDAYQFNVAKVIKKICGNKNPKNKELKKIQSLALLRNEIAKKLNLPPKDVIPNECILQLARNPVSSVEKMAMLRGFPKHIANQFGEKIMQAIKDSENVEPVQLRKPQEIESEPYMRQELDGVWSLFNAFCISKKLSVGLMTNRPTFTDWFLSMRNGDSIESSPLKEGWRITVLSQFTELIVSNCELNFSFDQSLQVKSDENN